ncbi:hypothetical protein E2C01_003031 [Portunus trituberculatus]|uniref:Uncharacterized protein n=1 Tax=Portunus trituberculatus TaxID=210409 RepID=A0A5B7CMX0_PORTR|nr:hypothetical protein [Portunus trituberculatus]
MATANDNDTQRFVCYMAWADNNRDLDKAVQIQGQYEKLRLSWTKCAPLTPLVQNNNSVSSSSSSLTLHATKRPAMLPSVAKKTRKSLTLEVKLHIIHRHERTEQLHKIVREDTNIACQLTLPPALVLQFLAQHCNDISLMQLQLILMLSRVWVAVVVEGDGVEVFSSPLGPVALSKAFIRVLSVFEVTFSPLGSRAGGSLWGRSRKFFNWPRRILGFVDGLEGRGATKTEDLSRPISGGGGGGRSIQEENVIQEVHNENESDSPTKT